MEEKGSNVPRRTELVHNILISEKALRQALGRYGKPAVLSALKGMAKYLRTIHINDRAEACFDYLDALEEDAHLFKMKDKKQNIQITVALLQDHPFITDEIQELVSVVNSQIPNQPKE